MARQNQTAIQSVPTADDSQIHTAIPVVLNILDKWQCTEEEKRALLGQLPRSSFYRLQKTPQSVRVTVDLADRLAYLLNIHAGLRLILSDPESVYGWVRRPNDHVWFRGRSAMEIMASGRMEDLIDVFRHIDAARGGWW
ncbi:MAG: MbcA/ParS/Xre antitoxin family protein [Marinobacter sp.]|uniref:MbcA/ParS/Xre antitoxin family protein n=1 Tax=Marinobacter sp. TaxID=50741 RepID=UPI00299ECD56|nr:MbcA/ParS/Xre antitoxin family protein [Marinobacter sp.]MDX1635277.1 MbcA/ParS/Xre antitoxin family protein [Marinobacter sp.]